MTALSPQFQVRFKTHGSKITLNVIILLITKLLQLYKKCNASNIVKKQIVNGPK